MSVKDDVKAELTKLGIAFDENATTAELKALLPDEDTVKSEQEPEFVTVDPEIARPKVLPLIISLPEGQTWKNPEQEAYAQILNSAAYCFPGTWSRLQKDTNGNEIPNSAPKHVELARLAEIGKNPDRFYFYTGTQRDNSGNLSYKNTVIQ